MLLNRHQKELFKERFPIHSTITLCQMYGTSSITIINTAKALGIYAKKPGIKSKWTDHQIEWVREHMDLYPSQMASYLQKSDVTIWKMKNKILNNL